MNIQKSKTGESPVFVFIYQNSMKRLAEKSILLPARQKIDGLNYSVFYLAGGYKIYIKVDKRLTSETFEKLILKDGPMGILRNDDFENSVELAMLKNSVRK